MNLLLLTMIFSASAAHAESNLRKYIKAKDGFYATQILKDGEDGWRLKPERRAELIAKGTASGVTFLDDINNRRFTNELEAVQWGSDIASIVKKRLTGEFASTKEDEEDLTAFTPELMTMAAKSCVGGLLVNINKDGGDNFYVECLLDGIYREVSGEAVTLKGAVKAMTNKLGFQIAADGN